MENVVFFHHRIKHVKTADPGKSNWDKGIEVKSEGTGSENRDAALQAYHAYLGAYAYSHDSNVDYVSCRVTDMYGNKVEEEIWIEPETPEPEPEPEE